MIDHCIKDYIRIVSSVSLPQAEKDRLSNFLIQKTKEKREFSKRHFAAGAASAVAVLAISTVLITRVTR